MSQELLRIEDLTIQYETPDGMLTAVSEASFTIDEGEHFGIVGESGCGKSTLAKAIIGGLDPNGRVSSGRIVYDGVELQDMSEKQLNSSIRWEEVSYIPQGSMTSLDPLQSMDEQAKEIAKVHGRDVSAAMDKFRELFEIMGLPPTRISDYPHEFSGGMQQRVIIALALFLEPSLIIADEPTTALDVIMQDQIFKYLSKVQTELDTSIILITHDISLVFESFNRMAVMHGGQVAEIGTVEEIYDDPRHPYSIMLQRAFPNIQHPNRELEVIEGKPPQNMGKVKECTFADRCPAAIEECRQGAPPLEPIKTETGEKRHVAACIRKEETPALFDEVRQSPGSVSSEGSD